jgi:predicted HicB family RNase H-like nuclease
MISPETSGAQATSMKAKQNPPVKQFPLRLARSLKAAAKLMADREGISLNHFITLAVAEKVSRIEQESSSPPRSKRA